MRRAAGLLLAIAGAVVSVVAQQAPPATGTGVIAGQVLDVTGGLPVPGIEVSLNRAVAPRSGSGRSATGPIPVLTDSQGRFVFSALPEGQYSLVTSPRTGTAPVRGAFVTLAADERISDVVLRVGRHGSIAGIVRDDAGDPVVGVRVRTFNRRSIQFRPVLFPRGEAATDDRGQFRIGDLPAGDYLVCACVRDALPIDRDLLARLAAFTVPAAIVARQLNEAILTFPLTFHPGGTRVADAMPITISPGEDRAGIDITMQAVTPRRVSGQLTGGGPNAGGAHKLLLTPEDEDTSAVGISEMEPVDVTPDGRFVFAGVPPGRYLLEVFPAEGAGLWASFPVVVADQDVSGLTVPLGPGATIRGRVEFSGSAPRPDRDTIQAARVGLVAVELTAAMLIRLSQSGSTGYPATIDRNGAFIIQGLPPGRYMVRATGFGPAWTVIESVRTNDGVSQGPLVTVDLSGTDSVVVTMSDTAMATLEGTFTLGRHESPNDTRVMMFPVDRAHWADPLGAPERFSFTGLSTAPTFRFDAVPPGDYYVVVVGQDELSTSFDRFAQWAVRATTVTLRPGETTTVTIK